MAVERRRRLGRDRHEFLPIASRGRAWVPGFVTAIALTDVAVISAAVVVAQLLRFGSGLDTDSFGGVHGDPVVVMTLLIAAWVISLRAHQSLDRRILGVGTEEYSRVTTACLSVFGVLAILVLVLNLEVSRGYFALALPLGTVGLLVSRWVWRRQLSRQRSRGIGLERLLLVGEHMSVASVTDRLNFAPEQPFTVVGACTTNTDPHESWVGSSRVPVYGGLDDVAAAVAATDATTVAVTSPDAFGHRAMQDLSWDLHLMDVDLLVAPGVADVAGPRMMVRPVAGLPLLHIGRPSYAGANRFRKALLDRVGGALIVFALAPLLMGIALAIKVDTRGPVWHRSDRLGVNNRPFRMWKFRSMVPDAEALMADLVDRNEGNGPLFKIHDDPRVTPVGRVIRRYSLDELPQLFNVLSGSMSLVGPRPPLPSEAATYDGRVARRMLVKPGMTGLWQVSGRSNLSWEESVRLDVSYVENWSIMQDAVILWRTFRAVVSKNGAY
ncbi:sugar transferase [Gordonia sp. SL306]|uniref:sugar transferase n=1 Tax=Gordonia sp. SL306 TaxID=2995145 RepID=UPI0022713AE6|nr:sugar transferase [Gordonia sp. SL306]WAC58015.1 sugar transferase [Gordonia sp. SL306]